MTQGKISPPKDNEITAGGKGDVHDTTLSGAAETAFDSGDFFALREILSKHSGELSAADELFYSAACGNAFSQTERSEELIGEFLRKFGDAAGDDYLFEILKLRADNMLRGFRYADAAAVYHDILGTFSGSMEEKEREEIENSISLWSPLGEVSPQTLAVESETVIPYRRTSFGHISVEVQSNGITAGFLFDTGANLSAVTESMAARMGMRIMETDVKVITSTGAAIRSRIAVADQLNVGKLIFRNVVFLLLRDEELDFGEFAYRIEGVVGIPVIRHMREVRITQDTITVPLDPTPGIHSNLCFEGLMPLVEARHDGERLLFTFDTGANRTELSHRYWIRNRAVIETGGIKISGKRAGGGGVVDVEGYELNNFHLSIGGKDIILPKIGVSLEPYLFNEHKDGNLGLDILGPMGGLIISFDGMFVSSAGARQA